MPADHFDGEIAAHYDADHAGWSTAEAVQPTVDFLAGLAAGRPVLEFAIGTGRVALPLQATGHDVDGIDLSAAMIEQLRAKPGSESITTVVGDIATDTTGRTYGLVYLVFNTIGNLLTQDAQVACFRNAAAHLEPGGHFVVEVGVPDLRRLTPGSVARVFDSTERHVGIDHYTDLVEQQATSRHFHIRATADGEDGADATVRSTETPFRYVWPSELDLMARLAGLHRVERWADWHRSSFTGESPAHVSVWRKGQAA